MTESFTALIQAHRRGDPEAVDRLYPLVQSELRRGAAALLRRERDAQSVQATELVNDALLRLLGATPDWQDRAHFLAVASRAMRQILVDYARQRRAQKRGAEQIRLSLDRPEVNFIRAGSERVLVLDAALTKLATFDQRKSRILEMRFFGGMPLGEIAKALKVSEPTIKRDMRMAKAWLRAEIGH